MVRLACWIYNISCMETSEPQTVCRYPFSSVIIFWNSGWSRPPLAWWPYSVSSALFISLNFFLGSALAFANETKNLAKIANRDIYNSPKIFDVSNENSDYSWWQRHRWPLQSAAPSATCVTRANLYDVHGFCARDDQLHTTCSGAHTARRCDSALDSRDQSVGVWLRPNRMCCRL